MPVDSVNLLAHWIDGMAIAGGAETIEVVNPANGAIVGRVPAGTARDVDDAVRAAPSTLPTTPSTGCPARCLASRITHWRSPSACALDRFISTEGSSTLPLRSVATNRVVM